MDVGEQKVTIKPRMHLNAIPGIKLVCIIFEVFPLIHMTNQEQWFVCLSGTSKIYLGKSID